MIEFKPEINGKTVNYSSYENNENTGCVNLTLDSSTHSTLQAIKAINDETAEGLIRSALTAAANRNIFSCNYLSLEFAEVAIRLGFVERNGVLYGEIPFLLSGCCGCNHNKCQ